MENADQSAGLSLPRTGAGSGRLWRIGSLAGHSYGGAMALEAGRMLGDRLASFTLVEPVSFHLLRIAGREGAWRQISSIAQRVREAVAAGRMTKGAAIYMQFWIGRLGWWLMPKKLKGAVVKTMDKVANEFGTMDLARTHLEDYAGIQAPTREVLEVLANVLPNASLAEVRRAGHMSPITHRHKVNALIKEHLNQYV